MKYLTTLILTSFIFFTAGCSTNATPTPTPISTPQISDSGEKGYSVLNEGVTQLDPYTLEINDNTDRTIELTVPLTSKTVVEFRGCSQYKQNRGYVQDDMRILINVGFDGKGLNIDTNFSVTPNKAYPVYVYTKEGHSHMIVLIPKADKIFSIHRIQRIVISSHKAQC